ncbi:MAG: thioredoxin fold domain-containing protein [Hyphomicrobiales bacterium]|nr:thioredoxin fold domain-containing protein [Hyphomicrobiales bacterium]
MGGIFWRTLAVVAVLAAAGPARADSGDGHPTLPKVEASEDGMYHQPWFHEGFLDLGEDLKEAAAAGKDLVVLWEQRGCPYCKKTHDVNLRIPRIVNYLKQNFVVVQLDLWGAREATDFDGEAMEERKLAIKWGIRYTPTVQFFKAASAGMAKSGKDLEVHRLFGYFFPFHFLTTFQYIREAAYETEPNFQRYLITKGEAYQAKGGEVDLMAEHLP